MASFCLAFSLFLYKSHDKLQALISPSAKKENWAGLTLEHGEYGPAPYGIKDSQVSFHTAVASTWMWIQMSADRAFTQIRVDLNPVIYY